MGFGLVSTVILEPAEIAKGCDAAFDEWLAKAAADNAPPITDHAERSMRFVWREGWLAAIGWFAVQAAEQAEDALQRTLTSECTGGNA